MFLWGGGGLCVLHVTYVTAEIIYATFVLGMDQFMKIAL